MDGFIDFVITALWLAIAEEPSWMLYRLGPGHCPYCDQDYVEETFVVVFTIKNNALASARLSTDWCGSADRRVEALYAEERAS